MPNSGDSGNAEKGEIVSGAKSSAAEEDKNPLQPPDFAAQSGLSQSSKDDIGVCVVIIAITFLAIIVTIIKIILFDRNTYPELFGGATTTPPSVNSTTK